ncbi:sulfatase [Novosphingobium pentaromativorans US6-1]|uniref:Sulfatase n=2 Tax=Novosphingobium pentaromativorans TaxID=205844 RepID=G6EGL0_9SPHN|nr:sulfatase [Novosphingobium pentaromativorans US6-1]
MLAGGTAAALSACATPGTASAKTKLPNIVWIVSEDNNPFIGAYGDDLARTPNIDRLARNGILYRNAYSNAPVCAPTRFTILTGVNAESCAPANHMRADAHLPPELRTYPEYMRQAGYYCTNNVKTDYNCDVEPARIWDESSPQAHWKNRPEGQPFLAVFNSMTTHESSLFRAKDLGVDPGAVRLPAYLPDLPEIREDYAKYYGLMEKMDAEVGAHLADLEAAGLSEDTIVFYYSDNGGVLPRSKRYCFDEGLRCALVVHVPEKWRHLAPAGPGSRVDAPVSFVDLAPTLLSLAGIPTPASMQGRAFLGHYMGVPKPLAFGMRNRMDERYDMVRTVTDGRFRYIRNYMPHRPNGQYQAFAWMAKGYQAWQAAWLEGNLSKVQSRFFEPRVFEEFYDLEADPDEVDNRIDEPGLRDRIAQMSKALDAHMVAINDNGFIPEGSQHEGYLASRKAGANPLKRLMALAARGAQRDAANLPDFVLALEDSNDAVRYWGAMGLSILAENAAPATDAILAAMRGDSSAQVRCIAAEAAAHVGQGEEAAAILGKLLSHGEDDAIRLHAVNALTYIGDVAKVALPQVSAAAEYDNEFVRNAARYLAAVLEGRFEPGKPTFDLQYMLSQFRKQGQP